MHLTRPKSSKGRSRPAAAAAAAIDSLHAGDHIHGCPESAVHSRTDRNLRSQSQPSMTMKEDQVLHLLRQRAPAAPPQSLNKYKVLPSIERRRSEASVAAGGGSLDKHMSVLTLSDHAVLQRRQSHEEQRADGSPRIRAKPPEPDPKGPTTGREAGANSSLVLAIRGPCGRRFEQRFESTDTLLMVRASAELKFGQQYRQALIETMDVPRRSFTDMDMTLDQCDIMNRSVLCITLNNNDSVVQHE